MNSSKKTKKIETLTNCKTIHRSRTKAKELSLTNEIDLIKEQVETEYTSMQCPESIRKENLKDIKTNPHHYIDINIMCKTRIVDNFAIPMTIKRFHYKNKVYVIDENNMYLLPKDHGFLMPTSFYAENKEKPLSFKNMNKGITGKALSLLYMPQLYESLFSGNEDKYNLFIVILSIVTLVCFGIGCYFLFGGKP